MAKLIQEMLFNIIGGLGIFLLGMRFMSDGLQNVAGPSLRKIISTLTYNRFFGVLVGLVVTTIIQSSSVTTVMVVGFVNSSIMTLNQALGVILGANIGTTFTGWILVLKVGKYGLPILGVAAFVFLFSKKERLRYIALTIMGIGMVFFGLALMKHGFKPIRKMPEFLAWFHAFDASTYFGVLKVALVGCTLTFIVQSSSATLGITIAMATQGIISFETGAALVMGENIGTTITAFLASIGTSPNARRSAYFHILFNVTGVFWITTIFIHFYLPFIHWFLDAIMGIPDINQFQIAADGTKTFTQVDKGIALVHTIFNVTNVILFLPFTHLFAKWLEQLVPDKKAPVGEDRFLTNLNFHMFDSPFAAVEQSNHEIERMRKHTRTMFDHLAKFRSSPKDQDQLKAHIFEREDIQDTVQKEITEFLTLLLADTKNQEVAEQARQQLRLCDEYESISDYITSILKLHLRLLEHETNFTKEQTQEITELHQSVQKFFDGIIQLSSTTPVNTEAMVEHLQSGQAITETIRKLRNTHWKRISKGQMNPLLTTSYMDLVASYRRIKDHLVNTGEAFLGEKVSD